MRPPFLALCLAMILTIGIKGEESVLVEEIPGTDLYTGIYYKVSMPAFPGGVVTWTSAMTDDDANFVQIDFSPPNLPNYEEDGKWGLDAHWMFTPTEEEAWFTWDNRVMSEKYGGITTCSYKEVGSGVHVIISKRGDHLLRLTPGGEWRNRALWKPVKVLDPGGKTAYQLMNKNLPQGTVTWTEVKYRDESHFIQIDTRSEHVEDYRPAGKWFNDSLFTFMRIDHLQSDVLPNTVWWWTGGGLVVMLLLLGAAGWGIIFYMRRRNNAPMLLREKDALSMSDVVEDVINTTRP